MFSLTCSLSSTSVKYKASTQRQIQQQKTVLMSQNENIKQREVILQQDEKKQYQQSAGTKILNPEKHR